MFRSLLLLDFFGRLRRVIVRNHRPVPGIGRNDIFARVEVAESRILLSAIPLGSESRINVTTTGDQNFPDVAASATGRYVVVWQSDGQDGSGTGIYARLFRPNGVALGSEFLINSQTLGDQSLPSVAMDRSGDFVVTWVSAPTLGDAGGIYARRYSSSGQAQGDQFLVSRDEIHPDDSPSVAMDAIGDFTIVWSANTAEDSWDIHARSYNAAGVPRGDQFTVNTTVEGVQINPEIAMDATGDFVVSWDGTDSNSYGIYAQRYDRLGTPQGNEFLVNTETDGGQSHSSVAMDRNGDFVIAWISGSGQDGSGYGIYSQRYSAAGDKQGGEFQVNTYTTQNQSAPAVAMDGDGEFVVSFQSSDPDGNHINARRYDADGSPEGDQFRVSSAIEYSQVNSAVAMDSRGDMIVVWQSNLQDGSGYGIYGQRFLETRIDRLRKVSAQQPIAPQNSIESTGVASLLGKASKKKRLR